MSCHAYIIRILQIRKEFVYLFIYLFVCLFAYLFAYLFTFYSFIHSFIHLFILFESRFTLCLKNCELCFCKKLSQMSTDFYNFGIVTPA